MAPKRSERMRMWRAQMRELLERQLVENQDDQPRGGLQADPPAAAAPPASKRWVPEGVNWGVPEDPRYGGNAKPPSDESSKPDGTDKAAARWVPNEPDQA